MKHLADNGSNVNISNVKQQTALHITVNKSNWKGSNVLIDKGADPSLQVKLVLDLKHVILN